MSNGDAFNEIIRDKILMAVRGDNLIYLADGEASKMDKVKESLLKVLNVPIIDTDIVDGHNIKELRENTTLLNDTFNYLIKERG